jgi:hypothetical protein
MPAAGLPSASAGSRPRPAGKLSLAPAAALLLCSTLLYGGLHCCSLPQHLASKLEGLLVSSHLKWKGLSPARQVTAAASLLLCGDAWLA